MIKRCFTFLLGAVCLLLLCPVAARADVIIEPNNDFYTRHRSECTYHYRQYYANGEEGYVSIREEPGSKKEVLKLQNGEIINIMFTYMHGRERWGVTEIFTPDKAYDGWPNGWIPMDQLLYVYDAFSFEAEHSGEFYTYTGSYETLETAKKIVIWSWPGSGEVMGQIDPLTIKDGFSVSHAYKDEQGGEWGYIEYWYGHRNIWICLSDPANEEIPAFNPPPQPELRQPGDAVTPDSTDTPKGGLSTPALIIILVAVLVAGTAVLIRVFWKPDKGKNK